MAGCAGRPAAGPGSGASPTGRHRAIGPGRRWTASVTIAIEIGDGHQQARAHTGLGHVHHAVGDLARARRHYRHALTLCAHLGLPGAEQIRSHLAAVGSAVAVPGC
ncbi:hypothetical protein ACWT_3927 [Actinoplanes sp. SE50]|uniref:tetratricopeptide repeat protein n=1 Tax=unclassified Actinoplanes TaxID=2626549 RepID=UPI00023ED24D|nr:MULTISPECIES: tetratricopeptide repeat protein [unclassified Actinoplanes]AEV84951.1 hypothetical protein ACPL_4056 [Actinoplanes sp. SE50/110]ATO83342.1 hypothetical protein ACWT_3927 [Actinoplanes sp. SE50]SLM00749.1 hypothetical protein ACSP50_3982 [Actinoplanes sp. SE50/110]